MNNDVEYEDDFLSDDDLTKIFIKAVEIENLKKFIKGVPISKYDKILKKSYLEYPNGDKKYEI